MHKAEYAFNSYLQTGECLFNGEHCTLMEYNLGNPTCPGCGSSVDISLIDPYVFKFGFSISLLSYP